MRWQSGIPTTYDGCEFRSRLEAKWAVFFDMCGWKWEYEPVDFKGWIPDFIILGEKPVYVEVKGIPFTSSGHSEPPKWLCDELNASGCDEEIMVVGMNVDDDHIGWLREKCTEEVWGWGFCGFGVYAKGYDFCHSIYDFTGRYHGLYEGGSYGRSSDKWLEETGKRVYYAREIFRAAGNHVKWRGGR